MSRGKGRQKWWCAACKKWAFGSHGRAEETMQAVVEAYGDVEHRVPKRVYPCPYNNGFHLTSSVERV